MASEVRGSATRWGPLFGAGASTWAETWEGSTGWGTPVYEHVIERAEIGAGTAVLDCGCGAGRFASIAAERGASVAGVDASKELIEIAAARVPGGEFQTGDMEALPWATNSFDLVTGFSAFQFADDKVRALSEAARVSRDTVAIVIPTRAVESGIASVFKPVFPLFGDEALASLKQSGIFALSEPGRLEEVLAAAGLTPYADDEVECPAVFEDAAEGERALLGAGPTQLAIRTSGKTTVAEAIRAALTPFTDAAGRVVLPGWFRAVLVRA